MNILLASMCLDIGGAETHVVTLATKLKKYGHTPIVISAGGMFENILIKNGIEHYTAPLNKKDFSSINSSIELIKNLVKQKEIDVIHAHARIPAFNCKIVSILTNTPFITTAHAKFKDTFIYKHTSFWGKKTICVSEDIKEHLVNNFKVKREKISIIENGIDADIFVKTRPSKNLLDTLSIKEDSKVIVNISRLKGSLAEMLLNVIDATYKAKLVDDKIELIIVGDGDDRDLVNKKVQEVNNKMNKPFIHMLGKRSDINDILNIGSLYIGVARSTLEAMSTSLPVILAGGEGYMGLITKENMALAIENNFTGRTNSIEMNIDDFSEDIINILKDTEEGLREDLGRAGRKVIIDTFSLDNKVKQTIDIYKSLVKEVK